MPASWLRAPWSARVIAQIPSEIALQSGVALHFRNGGILSMFDKNAQGPIGENWVALLEGAKMSEWVPDQ